jgi:hypothetical protein
MAKRDPIKTERNKEIKNLSQQINELLPEVLRITGFDNELSLNATYGGKMQEYVNVKFNTFTDAENFIAQYIKGFINKVDSIPLPDKLNSNYYKALKLLQNNKIVEQWLLLFLKRTFLKNYELYTKNKPKDESEALIWIGQEYASYGIGITPRFVNGQWENDKSEIRSFSKKYFSIGHILKTGLLIPNENETIPFSSAEEYLVFFKSVIVRLSKSKHEKEIAERYCNYVREKNYNENIPLLIPEFRYNGIIKEHKYRLDFCILDYTNATKVGFELSPWSTHGELTSTKDKTQKLINEEAQKNYYKEISKYKNYFLKYGITVLAYTDQDFDNYDKIFDDIKQYLEGTAEELTLKNSLELLKDYNLDQ